MKKILLSISLLAFILVSCAQSNCGIKRAYAFYTVNMPGMVMKDENGREVRPEPNIERFIYIEYTGAKMPLIETILYNNIHYTTTLTRVEGMIVSAGKKVPGGQDFTITCSKGNTLWKIDLAAANENAKAKENCKNIILRYKTGNKPCKNYIYKETEITGLPRY